MLYPEERSLIFNLLLLDLAIRRNPKNQEKSTPTSELEMSENDEEQKTQKHPSAT